MPTAGNSLQGTSLPTRRPPRPSGIWSGASTESPGARHQLGLQGGMGRAWRLAAWRASLLQLGLGLERVLMVHHWEPCLHLESVASCDYPALCASCVVCAMQVEVLSLELNVQLCQAGGDFLRQSWRLALGAVVHPATAPSGSQAHQAPQEQGWQGQGQPHSRLPQRLSCPSIPSPAKRTRAVQAAEATQPAEPAA